MREVRLVAAYARRSMLEWLGHRSFLTTLVLNASIAPLLGLALWSVALPDRQDISAYFLCLLVVQWATASQEYYSITMVIYDGGLIDDLLRPHAQIVRQIAEGLAYRLWNLAVGLPVLTLAIVLTGTGTHEMDARTILQAIPALLLAAALHFAFTAVLCLSALWVEQAGAITEIGTTLVVLLGGIAIPLALIPHPVQQIVTVLPFRAMAGFPAEIASGQLTSPDLMTGYACQMTWLLVFVALLSGCWRAGVRHYTAVGG